MAEEKVTPSLDEALSQVYSSDPGFTPEEYAQVSQMPEYAPAPRSAVSTAVGGKASQYDDLINQLVSEHNKGTQYQLDPNLVKAQIWAESSFNPNAVSSKGARGLSQFIPGTWQRFGQGSPHDPEQAIRAQLRYNDFLLNRYGGDTTKMLAAYNAGERNVDRYGIPPFPETRNYISKIQQRYQDYAGQAPQEQPVQPPADHYPVLFSDGNTVYAPNGTSEKEVAKAYKEQNPDAQLMRPIQLSNGNTIQAPEGTPEEEVLAAYKKQFPDEDVTTLTKAEHAKKTGEWAKAKSSFLETAGAGLRGASEYAKPVAEQLGWEGGADIAQKGIEKGKEISESAKDVYEPYTEQEFQAMGPIAGPVRKYGTLPVAGMAGSVAAAAPAFAIPGIGEAAGVAGLTAVGAGSLAETADRAGKKFEPYSMETIPYVVGEAVLNTAGMRALGPLRATLGEEFLAPSAREAIQTVITKEGPEKAAELVGSKVGNILKNVGITYTGAAASGVGSRALERSYAGEALDSPEALKEYLDIAIENAAGSIALGGLHGARRYEAKKGAVEEAQQIKESRAEAEQAPIPETPVSEAPTFDPASLGINKSSNAYKVLTSGELDVGNPEHHATINTLLDEVENKGMPRDKVAINELRNQLTGEPNAYTKQAPAEIDVSRGPQPKIRQEGEGAPEGGEGIRQGRPEARQAEEIVPPATEREAADKLLGAGLVKTTDTGIAPKAKALMEGASNVLNTNWIDKLQTRLINKHSAMRNVLARAGVKAIDDDGQLNAGLVGSGADQIHNIIREGTTTGIPVLGKDSLVRVKADARLNLDRIINDVDTKLTGYAPNERREIVGAVGRVLRGRAILNEDAGLRSRIETLEAKAAEHEAIAKSDTDVGARNKSARLAEQYREEANKLFNKVGEQEGEGRELKVKRDMIPWAEKMMENPEIANAIRDVRDVNRSLVDLLHKSGVINKETATRWNENPDYTPLYKSGEDLLKDPTELVQNVGGSARALPTVKQQKGGTHEVNYFENQQRHYAFMTALAQQNAYRKLAVGQLESLGLARKTHKGDPDAVMYRENGEAVYYHIDDPLLLNAFQAAAPLTNPLLKGIRGYSKFFRAATLVNPVYWYRQLVRDPIHANFVSGTGIITPVDSLKAFAKILAHDSKTYDVLRTRGIVGAVDSLTDPARFVEAAGRKRSLGGKASDWVMHIHEAADAATRVAVHDKAMKQAQKMGLKGEDAENFAAMKAREIINFSNQGASRNMQILRTMVPFMSSTLNSLDTIARAASGVGLSKAEASKLRQQFYTRAAGLATLTIAYALAMQDNEDYVKSKDWANNWLIPTGDPDKPFIKVPIPFEAGLLFKTLPEMWVRLNSGTLTPTEATKEALKAGSQTLQPLIPLPQIIKPLAEVVTNHDFFTGSTVESPSEQALTPTERSAHASELSKSFSKELNDKLGFEASPDKIEHFMHGMMTEVWAVTAALADAYLGQGPEKPEKVAGDYPIAKGLFTKPESDRALDTFYTMKNDAKQIADTVSRFENRGNFEKLQQFMANPENAKKFYGSSELVKIANDMSDIQSQIGVITDTPDSQMSPAQKKARIRELTKYKNKLAETGVGIGRRLGLED